MTETAGSDPTFFTSQRPAVCSAWVFAPRFKPLTFRNVFEAGKAVLPQMQIGTLREPDMKMPPAIDPGIGLLSINGEGLGVVEIDLPAPIDSFDIGPLRNLQMPDPQAVCHGHQAHYRVIAGRTPRDREDAKELASAVTLLARAIAWATEAKAIKWIDADHFVPPALIDDCIQWDHGALGVPGGHALPVWIRWLGYKGELSGDKLVFGSIGHFAFGHRDFEFEPSEDPPMEQIERATVVSRYLLLGPAPLKNGDVTQLDENVAYRVEHQPRGILLPLPICRLVPVRLF